MILPQQSHIKPQFSCMSDELRIFTSLYGKVADNVLKALWACAPYHLD